eukprot:CAMPEP_0118636086 /NCGR_PEP_ID=MMETSP0785-20121206/2425_1 /TAXON_ID=91992 /ORGANISM="Bolidomonas pacifica, Strain CCMP 1866" /LENGTH=1007 /DNA_ID=CAMNT_0006527169 /DNA_START=30 /DNA_END=3049 /DNA_ORIENTATION=-
MVRGDMGCEYFVRYRQSSNTNQYVGGTAESIWSYCDGETTSVPITSDWVGTSKSPQIFKGDSGEYLLYLSDYTATGPGLLNIFATKLMSRGDLYPINSALTKEVFKITTMCDELMPVMEISVDKKTNDVVYRSGADLYVITKEEIEGCIASGTPTAGKKLDLIIQSDFSQTHEHLVTVQLNKHISNVDVVRTKYGQVNALLTVRGQGWVAPADDDESTRQTYGGGYSKVPLRRYRLAPGYMNGGSMRVMAVKSVNETHSLILATDYESKSGAEENFYLLRSDGKGEVVSSDNAILSTLGSTREGGLGSVIADSIAVSPTGKLAAFFDTDGRLCVLDITKGELKVVKTWIREFSELKFSPGGRYLGFTHSARNQFTQISIIDTTDDDLEIVHATSDRFNCRSFVWGDGTLYFLSDRDVNTDIGHPWGTRAQMPHLDGKRMLFGLDLVAGKGKTFEVAELQSHVEEDVEEEGGGEGDAVEDFDFGTDPNIKYTLARNAYLIQGLAPAEYEDLFAYTGGGLLMLFEDNLVSYNLKSTNIGVVLESPGMCGSSSSSEFVWCMDRYQMQVVEVATSSVLEADVDDFAISVHPRLEWYGMFGDSWRMLRDYFYDVNMHGLDWEGIYEKYLPLVSRVGHREELDHIFKLMASELSALHVFVYGGEYRSVMGWEESYVNEVASLGASLSKTAEGYEIDMIFEGDPDYPFIAQPIYSPLSHKTLSRSNQVGLEAGDVIVSINNEDVRSLPSLWYALRGQSGRSVRLGVLRKKSVGAEFVVVAAISPEEADELRYSHWEWETRQNAKEMAKEEGFEVGYVHLRSMSGAKAENAFMRGFFEDYNKEGLILDVRNNHGGNIDSWVLDSLQRQSWMYWESRNSNITNGGLGWDEQFAFRGDIVVLVNEHTASDGEGVTKGIMELGLGTVVGTRTWGGGIWLSSDNRLVDGALGGSAPEVRVYDESGKDIGVENHGVVPDIVVDNDPLLNFPMNTDSQLEKAIEVLKGKVAERREKGPFFP